WQLVDLTRPDSLGDLRANGFDHRRVRSDVYLSRHARHIQFNRQVESLAHEDGELFSQRFEALCFDFQVISAGAKVREAIPSFDVARSCKLLVGLVVDSGQRDATHYRAAYVFDAAAERTGRNALLSCTQTRKYKD